MEFVMTWREKVTPAGRSYFQLVASARRSSGKGCSGALKNWPAPDHHHHGSTTPEKALARINSETKRQMNLEDAAALASWPGPAANEFCPTDTEKMIARRTRCADTHGNNGFGLTLGQAVAVLTPWNAPRATDGTNGGPNQTGGALPSARDHKDTPGMATTGVNPDGSTRHRMDQLPRQVHGLISASSAASTEPIGASVLNAAMSRWLMGFPATWDRCSPNSSEWALIARLLSECGGPRPGFWRALAEIASADSGATGTPSSHKRRLCSSGR